MPSYQCRNSQYKDKTVSLSSYLYNGILYLKRRYLCWNGSPGVGITRTHNFRNKGVGFFLQIWCKGYAVKEITGFITVVLPGMILVWWVLHAWLVPGPLNRFRSNFKFDQSSHKEMLYIPRQQSCLGMCNTSVRLDQFSLYYSEDKFHRIPNPAGYYLVERAPGSQTSSIE